MICVFTQKNLTFSWRASTTNSTNFIPEIMIHITAAEIDNGVNRYLISMKVREKFIHMNSGTQEAKVKVDVIRKYIMYNTHQGANKKLNAFNLFHCHHQNA